LEVIVGKFVGALNVAKWGCQNNKILWGPLGAHSMEKPIK